MESFCGSTQVSGLSTFFPLTRTLPARIQVRASVRDPIPVFEKILSSVFNGCMGGERTEHALSQWYSEGIAPAILIRSARQLVTLRGPRGPRRGRDMLELAISPDAGLLLRDGLIDEVGSMRRLENLAAARGAVEIDATGK